MDKEFIPDRVLLFISFIQDLIRSVFVIGCLYLVFHFYWGVPMGLSSVSIMDVMVTVVVSGVVWVIVFYPARAIAWGLGYLVSVDVRKEWISVVDSMHN